MAFATNITGVPTTGQYGPDGKPVNINNDGGIEVTPQDGGNVPSAGTESREGVNNDKGISGNPYNPNASSTDTPSPVGNPNMGNYVESISQRVVDEGSWNSFTAEYSTAPFSAESGYWNVGNSIEASPYVNTLKVDNAIRDDNISTIGGGGGPQPVVPERNAPDCDCRWFIEKFPPQWGAEEYEVEYGTEIDCQSSRNEGKQLLNHKVFWFSGVYDGLSGIFALLPNPELGGDPTWVNSLDEEVLLYADANCWPPDALRTAINGGVAPGPNCTYRHETLAYRGTGVSDVGVSGTNWTGWCSNNIFGDQPYEFYNKFYESRADCQGKKGYLYACDDGVISELTPTYNYTLEDSCDCHARYQDGAWSSKAWYNVFNPLGANKGQWVENSQPDWDASNSGTGYRPTSDENFRRFPPTQVYWTGAGCWLRAEEGRNETYKPELDKTKVFTIVATGGGGPGAGDNIPPYWSDTECDWIYAIREVVETECTDAYNKIEGCPTGPIIEIGLTKLHDAQCGFAANGDFLPCPGIDWTCCLSGTGEDPGSSGYCTSIYNRGPIYPNGDYVCYADGTGNVPGSSGQNWIVNSDSNWDGVTGVACNWTYDLQYYNPHIPGPSGALQTGILESAISTGCV